MNERKQLLSRIQSLSFALVEINLYLDSHPNDADALAYYRENNDRLQQAMAVYEEKYGPITVWGNGNRDEWQWVKTPWPWEED